MTREEFAEYSETELRKFAEDISRTIVIREYINGNSKDTRRETTKPEKEIIFNIAYSAMLSYGFVGCDVDGIFNMAEFTLSRFIPTCNSYDTIYCPLRDITETW